MGATIRLALAGVRHRGIGQVLVLVAVTALTAAAIVAGLAGGTTAADLVHDAYARVGQPDVVLTGSADALRAAADDDAVSAASPPARRASGDTVVDGNPVEVVVTAVDPDQPADVGGPHLVEGRWPASADEVVVERSLLAGGVVELGGTLDVETSTGSHALRVVGAAVELSDCFWPTCDPLRTFGPEALVADLAGDEEVHVASLRLADPDRAAAVAARLQEADPEGIRGTNVWPDTRGDILVMSDVFGAMVSGFGAFLLVSACVVIAGATAARLVARRRSLALLRAIGFRPGQLTVATLAEHLVIGMVGVVIGWVLGSLAAPGLGEVDDVVGGAASTFDLGTLLIAALLVGALLSVAVVVPAWRAGRVPAAEVLHDVPTAPSGGRAVAAVARRLGASASTVAGLRRTLARPGRAALATVALLVAAVGAVVTAGFIGTVTGAIHDPARTGNPFDAYAVPTSATDEEVASALDATPEVGSWHTERDGKFTFDEDTYLLRALGGGDADHRVEQGRPLAGAGEALAGYGFLQEAGVDVGDTITVAVDGRPMEVVIVGRHLDVADAGKVLLVREETLPAGVAIDDSTTFRITAADGVDPDALAAALSQRLGDGATVAPLDAGAGEVGGVVGTLVGFALLLAAVALANLLATTVAATRERARSLGVLRTIGCTTRQLVGQSAVGTGLLGLVAGLVGVPLGWWLFGVLGDAITSGVGVGPGLVVSPPAWILVAIVPAAALLAAGSGALAALGLARRPAAELVRYE